MCRRLVNGVSDTRMDEWRRDMSLKRNRYTVMFSSQSINCSTMSKHYALMVLGGWLII